jgi:hypothetical protein
MIGNYRKAIPRYANLGWAGIRGREPGIPHVGMPGSGKADAFVYQTGQFINERPLVSGAGLLAANHFLTNPIGGFVDALTFGATDFRQDNQPEQLQQQIVIQPNQPGLSQQVSYSVPALNADQIKRQQDYLNRKVATDMLTLEALRNAQAGIGGMY